MPFVQRVVEPRFLSRTTLWTEDGAPKVPDSELEAVTNNTLSNALRQLASLVLIANDIFAHLGGDLQKIAKRSEELRGKMGCVEERLAGYDPKKVPVPESDISAFAQLKRHHASKQELTTNLFRSDTRPNAVKVLYEVAAKTPVHLMRQMDKWRRDGHRSSKFFLCTPVLGRKRKIKTKIDIDIETSMPAAVEELRRWTSNEALGDVTITADCQNRIPPTNTTALTNGDITDSALLSEDEGIDHKLPSPEEQQHVIAMRFPPEVVSIDVTGRSFDRMSLQRRSLLHADAEDGATVRRKPRTRRSRSKRRNTLAGTDEKEIADVLGAGDSAATSNQHDASAPPAVGPSARSKSTDLLRANAKKESPETAKRSHFDSLKQWGKNRLKILNKYTERSPDKRDGKENEGETNLYETVTAKRKRSVEREKKRQPSGSSSERSAPPPPAPPVKLRDSSLQRRLRRSGGETKEEPHSSSGNWSASSESGRASIGSEITTHPKSTTSAATSSNSLNIHPPGSAASRRRYDAAASTSGSCTSEGTLTPDIIHDLHEDGETSSAYSCDTEGYYTSFHVDSGLKTLREEDGPQTPIHSSTVFYGSAAENEYELFGKGSTSTTTSSAGTVCTTLRAADSDRSLMTAGPAVPERKSSLNKARPSAEEDYSEKTGTVKRSPLRQKGAAPSHGDVSPDSGHNSSPIEPSANSPGSEFEFSEASDVEGADRLERIRAKTAIDSSRIPSMCAITPPVSDDESAKVIETNLDHLDIVKETTMAKTAKMQLNGFGSASPSGGTVTVNETKAPNLQGQPIFRSSLLPLNNVLGKLRTNWGNAKKRNGETDEGDADRNLRTVLSGKVRETTEYVSLDELPTDDANSLERKGGRGARVTLDAEGKVVYSSDSLPRRKGSSTFEPGPFVKEAAPAARRPMSPQLGKVVIRAGSGTQNCPTSEVVRMQPSTVVTPVPHKSPFAPRGGAHVRMPDGGGGAAELRNNGHQSAAPDQYPAEEDEKMMETDRRPSKIGPYSTLPSRKKPCLLNEPDITRDLGRTKWETLGRGPQVSPIGPRGNAAGFKSSTPADPPRRPAMSNDELHAVIHKSKKKLNVGEEFEAPPAADVQTIEKVQPPETGYFDKAKSRLSWSPKNEPRSRQSWGAANDKKSQAARLDFKRLLLQHCRPSLPPSTGKLSAVEQLKLSKAQIQAKAGGPPADDDRISILDLSRSPRSAGRKAPAPRTPEKNRQPPKILSPRSQWRFASPRSDVLSSTILEDLGEDDSPNGSAERKRCANENNNTSESDGGSYKTIAEKIQARRAQFFGSDNVATRKIPEKPLLPTLETAF